MTLVIFVFSRGRKYQGSDWIYEASEYSVPGLRFGRGALDPGSWVPGAGGQVVRLKSGKIRRGSVQLG